MSSGDADQEESGDEVLSLEDQLGDLDLDLPDEPDEPSEPEPTAPDSDRTATEGQPVEAGADFTKRYEPPTDDDLDDRELFEKAVADVDPDEARRAKQADAQMPPEQQPDIDIDLSESTEDEASGGEPSSSESAANSERELFEEAVTGLEREDMYRGKFEGQGPTPPEAEQDDAASTDGRDASPNASPESSAQQPPRSEQDGEKARRRIEQKREEKQFQDYVGDVDERVEDNKRRPRPDRDPAADVQRRVSGQGGAGGSPDFVTPMLPTSGRGLSHVGALAPEHRKLIARFEKHTEQNQVFEVNVRGLSVDEALEQLAEFVRELDDTGEPYGRVVHGRGLQSDGEPVLKPAVLEWVADQGASLIRGYAPELNDAGDYGSIIIELVGATQS